MPKSKERKKYTTVDKVPTAKPMVEAIAVQKERVAKVRESITKDGKYDKYDPKYRQAKAKLKKLQRHLLKERIRFSGTAYLAILAKQDAAEKAAAEAVAKKAEEERKAAEEKKAAEEAKAAEAKPAEEKKEGA